VSRSPRCVFLQHDVTLTPLPVPRQTLLFCRFLLAHLSDPAGFSEFGRKRSDQEVSWSCRKRRN